MSHKTVKGKEVAAPIITRVKNYKKEEGALILMKGPKVDDELEEAAQAIQRLGLKVDRRIRFQLPFSKSERAIVVLR